MAFSWPLTAATKGYSGDLLSLEVFEVAQPGCFSSSELFNNSSASFRKSQNFPKGPERSHDPIFPPLLPTKHL